MMVKYAHERKNPSAQVTCIGMLDGCHDGPDELLFETVWSGSDGQLG
jgi:hypothetical protein